MSSAAMVGARWMCVALSSVSLCFAAAPRSLSELGGGVVVVLGCGEARAPEVAVEFGRSGNTLVHAIGSSKTEVEAFNKAIIEGGVKGVVSAEGLELSTLPYRDHMVNAMIIMDIEKAKADGLTLEEARRCVAPFGALAIGRGGRIETVETLPLPDEMDVWTHRYYRAGGIPDSSDGVFDLPIGFKWNAALPMNFDNPVRAANRYSSTRAMVVDDGRCFTFSEAVYENLGAGWKSDYGTNQYLVCRDAFNGRFLWQKQIGGTYYGGLYIENMAPLVSTGRKLYLAGEKGSMLVVDTRTGETVRELRTANIPGVIAASDGIVVAATWKGGRIMGSIKRYDRRRMDWEIESGTVEAYDDETGKLLWKKDVLGTSLVIAEGRVFVVSRTGKDDIEKNHGKPVERTVERVVTVEPVVGSGGTATQRVEKVKIKVERPIKCVVAMDLGKGTVLWTSADENMGLKNQRLSVEAAATGAVAVAYGGRSQVKLLSAATGELLAGEAERQAQKAFFRYRNHVCTPVFVVNGIRLANRGGRIDKEGKAYDFGGARAACLTGTVPAYGAGYIAQNWCNCSPGQIPGLLAVAPIGTEPTPSEMEKANAPIVYGRYDGGDGVDETEWVSFRGNARRNSSVLCEVATNVTVAWSSAVVEESTQGTVSIDWRDYLNSQLTAPVLTEKLAIVGDIDHNEVIALNRADGSVVWRHLVCGRLDAAPTVCGGICLVGDHSGYVTALNAKSGERIYRLRIAPCEKRMVSYGKMESVWPVIGGVMVADGRAYVSAGRTQGSDGGLVVRAFKPETGEQLWARALPQQGHGVIEKKPRRNDALFLENGLIRIMDHRLDPLSGEIVRGETTLAIEKAQELKAAELGRKLDGRELQQVANQVRATNGVCEVAMGNEGIYSWNWTRLGHRKFHHIGYAGLKGDTVCWSDTHAGCTESRGGRLMIKTLEDAKTRAYPMPKGYLVTSLVMCGNTVVQGGAIADQGDRKGFVRAVSVEDGRELWQRTFAEELAFNGLAVDSGDVFASFDDGTVVLLK